MFFMGSSACRVPERVHRHSAKQTNFRISCKKVSYVRTNVVKKSYLRKLNFCWFVKRLMAEVRIASDWKEILGEEFTKPYFEELVEFVRSEYAAGVVYPAGANIFRAFDKCPFDKLKVVIIGQDPYHGPGQANGLCFSVGEGVPFPPSLQNILREVSADTGALMPTSGELERWAEQGVLLLNAVLTVRAHQAASHAGHGWETFTDAVVRAIAERKEGIVYMLWGSYAQRKGAIADPQKNLVLRAVHPSPLSAYRGFFGCRHFSQANDYLRSVGREAIVW